MISQDIAKAVELLNNNEVVAIPTETVYGLAGNIYSEQAIQKIFSVKKRPYFNPLIVHVSSIEQAKSLATEFPAAAKKLAEAFWPGSLTLILKKQPQVPDIITAGKDSVALRIPNHPVALALLRQLDYPLAAPSANPFGSISPTQASHVDGYFNDQIALVLDGGPCENGIESTIMGFENNKPVVYRLGAISLEDIEAVIGKVSVKNKKEVAPLAPGMLSRHYAPKTKTHLVEHVALFLEQHTGKKIGVIVHSENIKGNELITVKTLPNTANLKEAASLLYLTMHQLDALELDLIVAQRFLDHGMGKSINDRLERATKAE